MKILAMFAALLASTAIASAEPKLGVAQPPHSSFDRKASESTGRVVLTDRKAPRARKGPVLVGGWAEITDATPARFGTVFVRVGTAASPFAKLRFDAVTGTVMIRQVKVHYVDGTAKVFAIRKSVNVRRTPSTVIDLGGAKQIEQIDITTDRRPTGEYSIHGSAAVASTNSCC